jgi:hypothetical protein
MNHFISVKIHADNLCIIVFLKAKYSVNFVSLMKPNRKFMISVKNFSTFVKRLLNDN